MKYEIVSIETFGNTTYIGKYNGNVIVCDELSNVIEVFKNPSTAKPKFFISHAYCIELTKRNNLPSLIKTNNIFEITNMRRTHPEYFI